MTRVCTAAAVCVLWLTPLVARAQASAPATPPAVEIVLAMPFENEGAGARLAWMDEGLALLTARRLAAANRIVLPRAEWVAAAERLGLGPSPRISHASLLKIAQQADADFVVFGRFSVSDGRLTLTAQALRLDGPRMSPSFDESGPLDQFVEIHARLCWRLLQFFDFTLAVSQQDFVSQATPLRLDAFENYARASLAFGAERIRLLREAARLEPDWPDAAFALGEAYMEAGNFESALIWLSRVPPASAFGLEAGFYAGVCHLLRNDAPRAEAAMRALLERPWYPDGASPSAARRMDLPEVLNNLAIAYSRQGQWSEAQRLWATARERAPAESAYAFNLALGALRANEPAAAEQALRDALRLRPDDQARALLAALLDRAGRKQEATAERAACEAQDCGQQAEVQALFARDATPAAAAQLDRVSISLDMLTWLLSGQPHAPAAGDGAAARKPLAQKEFTTHAREGL